MSAVLRSAIVGCGMISQEHLRFLQGDPRANLVAVCDTSPVAGRFARQTYGAGTSFTDHRAMLAEARPDVVHVLTPPHTHRAIVEDALDANASVVCEKPITFTTAELRVLGAKAQERGLRLIENHNYRFNDQILALDRLVRAGDVGDILSVDVFLSLAFAGGGRLSDADAVNPATRPPAGAIHDVITHTTYLALHYLGPEPVDFVDARWQNLSGDKTIVYDELAALIGAGPATATIRISGNVRPEMCRVIVRGTKGGAETDLYQPYLRADISRRGAQLAPLINQAVNGANLLRASGRNFRDRVLQHSAYHGIERLLDTFYTSIIEGTEQPVSFAEMERTAMLIDAMVAKVAAE